MYRGIRLVMLVLHPRRCLVRPFAPAAAHAGPVSVFPAKDRVLLAAPADAGVLVMLNQVLGDKLQTRPRLDIQRRGELGFPQMRGAVVFLEVEIAADVAHSVSPMVFVGSWCGVWSLRWAITKEPS